MMVDCNNLYGYAMLWPLPVGDYRWLSKEECDAFDVRRHGGPNSSVGYILEVDLTYPEHLHIEHNSFPLACESRELTHQQLSPYSQRVAEALKFRSSRSARKLTATFLPRKKYLVHCFALAYYVEKGLRLDKVHRAISFTQEPFMKHHVLECSKRRMEAPTEAQKTVWKLFLNSTYGKFIENSAKRMDVKFNRSEAAARTSASSPLFKSNMILGENLSMAFFRKRRIRQRQCWLVGFSILEISKLHMARLYYEHVKPAFKEQVSA